MSRPSTRYLLALVLFCSPLHADTSLYFVGQFGDRAVIHIDGKQRTLKVGETSREGVKLLSVDANNAVVIYNGKKQSLGFSAAAGKTYKARESTEVRIWADASGSFQTPGSINGHLVNFLVDTGATTVAMNEVVARKLGIDFRYSGTPGTVSTASGIVPAYNIMLTSIKIGSIELRNIQATVLEGGFPLEVLLGMSFLSRVELERKGNLITLRKTH
jgi:aspartyl protease family protein